MLKLSDNLSVRLTNLTFVCTLLILLMHLPTAGLRTDFLPGELRFVTHLAVPIFFAISGYLLARKSNENGWYASLLMRRFWTLVVPYFAICSVYVLPLIVYHNILHAGNWPGEGLWFDCYTIKRVYGLTHEYHPACGPFWYIRCLIFFIVLSPMPLAFIKKSKWIAFGGLLAILLSVSSLESSPFGVAHGNLFYSFFSLRGVVFFVSGMVLAYYGVEWTARRRFLTAVICLCIGEILRQCENLDSLFLSSLISILSWLMLAAGIFLLMPTKRLPRFFTAGSFSMFALHTLIYMGISVVIRRVSIPSGFIYGVIAISCLLMVVILCCLMAKLLHKYTPAISKVLFGGR